MLSFGLTNLACYFVGMLYPIYGSFRAIESNDVKDDAQWLTYWVVYMTVEAFEVFGAFALNWIPFYYEQKLMFLIWLFAPQTRGAQFLYDNYIKPFLVKHASQFDPIFKKTEQALNSSMANKAALTFEKTAPEYGKLGNLAKTEAAKIQGVLNQQLDKTQ